MPVPSLTHLQFAVLDALGAKERPGREVRERLAEMGVAKSGPAFYRLMARLEEAGFLTGEYHQKTVLGQHLRERRYRITAHGVAAANETALFYIQAGLING
ncbi:MAG: helix-turn-helix transcriptional regulator, partial [Planctomycetes bacterium]|nr:helix-turn-helix transcriptional regulator [Planctomycetota bacterium]